MRLIFDGHLDLSWNALSWGRDITLELDELNAGARTMTDHPARGRATTTLPEMRRGAIAAIDRLIPDRFVPPDFFAGFQVKAHQRAVQRPVAVYAVQISILGDRVHEVRAKLFGVPHFFC